MFLLLIFIIYWIHCVYSNTLSLYFTTDSILPANFYYCIYLNDIYYLSTTSTLIELNNQDFITQCNINNQSTLSIDSHITLCDDNNNEYDFNVTTIHLLTNVIHDQWDHPKNLTYDTIIQPNNDDHIFNINCNDFVIENEGSKKKFYQQPKFQAFALLILIVLLIILLFLRKSSSVNVINEPLVANLDHQQIIIPSHDRISSSQIFQMDSADISDELYELTINS